MLDDHGIVYLLHFKRPYKRAQHYIGFTSLDLNERLRRHRHDERSGARLLYYISNELENPIQFEVVRTWPGTFRLEQSLKSRKKASRLCPVCNPNTWRNNASNDWVLNFLRRYGWENPPQDFRHREVTL